MKYSRHILLMCITFLFVISLVVAGCSKAAKKPTQPMLPTTPFSYQNASPTPIANTPINPISPMEITNQTIIEARRINGVKEASVFVNDRVIYIGLDLKENSQQQVVERNVMKQIISLQSGYLVRVTANIDTVKLIKTVSQGLAQGKSISSYNHEVTNITIKLTPKGSRLLNLQLNTFYIMR